jgi:hypothetical protein
MDNEENNSPEQSENIGLLIDISSNESKTESKDNKESPNNFSYEYSFQQQKIKTNDENWTGANLETLSQWIQISAFQIEALELCILYYRSIVRRNVLLGLIFSTASGSLSLSQMNSKEQQFIYNLMFTFMSFSIAIFTGLIKIYQIQERLEEFIKLKQEWIGFSVVITTEVQLPVCERKRALDLITKNKNKYLDLLKRDADIPFSIKTLAYKHLYSDKEPYLDNLKKYKKLKEIACCTDEKYFIKAARLLEKDEASVLKKEDSKNCFEWFFCFKKKKNKYTEKKTALSNIILNVIMEEEDEQRNYKIIELLNIIRERKTFIESKMTEYDLAMSSNQKLNSMVFV